MAFVNLDMSNPGAHAVVCDMLDFDRHRNIVGMRQHLARTNPRRPATIDAPRTLIPGLVTRPATPKVRPKANTSGHAVGEGSCRDLVGRTSGCS